MAKSKPKSSRDRNFQDKDPKSRGGRNNRPSKTRSSRPYKDEDSQVGKDHEMHNNRGFSNDPAWWMKAGELSKDTTSISTLQPVGYKGPTITTSRTHFTPAGIAKFEYIPYFGRINSVVHPINVAAKLLYDTINSKNSRNPQYDPSDLMCYVLAVANAWALHSWVLRVVGMYNTFSVLNRYWWQSVAESMGISVGSISSDIVQWRNLANLMAMKLNMLCVPNAIAYFARTVFLPSAVYADSPTQKASLYYFQPVALLKYEYDNEGLGMLRLAGTPFASRNDVTPAQVENYFNALTQDLFNDSDINTMGADILKAYGIENCFRLPMVSSDYSVMFNYDPVVNLQLHNATVIPTMRQATAVTGYKITQDMHSNLLSADWKPTWEKESTDSWMHNTLLTPTYQIPLDFPTDEVSNEMVVEATRLTAFIDNGMYVSACTEVLVRDKFYVFEDGEAAGTWELHEYENCTNLGVPHTVDEVALAHVLDGLECTTKFHDAPISYIIYASEANGYKIPSAMSVTSDFTNFTTVSRETLRTMHNTCLLSVFSPNLA